MVDRRYQSFARGHISSRKLNEILQEIGENVIAAGKEALADGANEIAEEAKGRCPVKTGALRDSIKAVPNKTGLAYKIRASAQATDGTYYGQYVEFDPRIRHPFLYPALDAKRDEVKGKIIDAIREAIAKSGH